MTLILNGTDNSATTPAVTGTDTDTGVYYPAANQVALATNGVVALLVDASQRVSIGTSTALSSLTLANSMALGVTSATTGDFLSSGGGYSSAYNGIALESNSRALTVQANTSLPSWFIDLGGRAADGTTFPVTTSDAFRIARVSAGGSYYGASNLLWVNSNGCLGLTVQSASTGVGITFPATQSASTDANTLDDYEEGTWTPTIIGSSSNPTITYGARDGRYTKIGRVCYFMCIVTMSAYSGGSGRVLVTGLPFVAGGSGSGNGAPSNTLVSNMNMSAGYSYITNYVDPATTNFNWLEIGDNVSYNDMLVSSFQASTTFIVSGFYIVA